MTLCVVGIVNLSPDSFSQDGIGNKLDDALTLTQRHIDEGARMIDVGAISTRPQALLLSPDEEWERIAPLLEPIVALCHSQKVQVSIDSWHYETLCRALTLGVDVINDQSGLTDRRIIALLQQCDVPIVIMHHLGLPASKTLFLPEESDVLSVIGDWFLSRSAPLLEAGIAAERIILDPGIGFGKNAHQSLTLLRNIGHFHSLGHALYVGHSRKSFMNPFTHLPFHERDLETAYISAYLAGQGVQYLRVHNVAATQRMIQVSQALKGGFPC